MDNIHRNRAMKGKERARERELVGMHNKYTNKLRCEQHTDDPVTHTFISLARCWPTYPFKIESIQLFLVLTLGTREGALALALSRPARTLRPPKLYLLLQIRVTELVFITLGGRRRKQIHAIFLEKCLALLFATLK